ncbi:MAG: hypothetical protein GC157_15810 [Frankiales bacterium]|nr:hypothetical protein [Frankiales bacterium]
MRLGRVLALGCVAVSTACALAPSDPANSAVRDAVVALPAPPGWAEVGAAEGACAVINLDCQDRSVRRVFRTTGDLSTACADLVGYVGTTPALAGAEALAGTSSQPPAEAGCVAAVAAGQPYVVLAHGPVADSGDYRWRLELVPAAAGLELTVALGDPPLDRWPDHAVR